MKKPLNSMYVVSENENIILKSRNMYIPIAKLFLSTYQQKFIPEPRWKDQNKGRFWHFFEKNETRKEGKAQRLRAVVAQIKAWESYNTECWGNM